MSVVYVIIYCLPATSAFLWSLGAIAWRMTSSSRHAVGQTSQHLFNVAANYLTCRPVRSMSRLLKASQSGVVRIVCGTIDLCKEYISVISKVSKRTFGICCHLFHIQFPCLKNGWIRLDLHARVRRDLVRVDLGTTWPDNGRLRVDGGPSGPMVKCGGAEVRMLKSVKCGSNLWRKFADMTGKMPMCGGANMIDCNDDYTLNFIGEFSPNVFLQKKVVCVYTVNPFYLVQIKIYLTQIKTYLIIWQLRFYLYAISTLIKYTYLI